MGYLIKRDVIVILFPSLILFYSCTMDYTSKYKRHVQKAILYKEKGELAKALKELNLALAIDSSESNLYVLRGEIFAEGKDEKIARANFSKAISINSRNTNAYFQKALSYSVGAIYDSAIKNFNYSIDSKKYGDFYVDIKKNELAEFELEVDIPEETIRYFRGKSFYYSNQDSAALEDFRYSLEHNFQMGKSHLYIGLILISYGQKKQGCIHIEKALTIGETDAQLYITKYCN